MGEEHGRDHDKKQCATINVYCGDKDPPHPPHKKDCCDTCDATEEGRTYVAYTDVGFITPVAVEITNEMLVNPAGSGKRLYVTKRSMAAVGSDDENIIFRYYFNPTVIAQGVAGTVTSLNQSLPLKPSVAQLWAAPTVGPGFGSPVDVFNVCAPGAQSDVLLVLDEGQSLLVTVRANAENSRAAATLYWTECKKHHWPHQEP